MTRHEERQRTRMAIGVLAGLVLVELAAAVAVWVGIGGVR